MIALAQITKSKTKINSMYITIYMQLYTHRHSRASRQIMETFLQAHSHIKETDYPQKMGLIEETINRFKLSYIAKW